VSAAIGSRSGPRLDPAEAILIAHQRHDYRRCICGWAELGKSHPGHQVAMLRAAGLLVDAR
jgi:hypothetical protein